MGLYQLCRCSQKHANLHQLTVDVLGDALQHAPKHRPGANSTRMVTWHHSTNHPKKVHKCDGGNLAKTHEVQARNSPAAMCAAKDQGLRLKGHALSNRGRGW